jgi:hypothetical protein
MKDQVVSTINPSVILGILRTSVEDASKLVVADWNEKSPDDPINIRFTQTNIKLKNKQTHDGVSIKVQASLTLEIRRNFEWHIISRKISNFTSAKALEDAGVLYELELWSLMFVEITHMGLLSALSLSEYKQQTKHDDHETKACGSIANDQAVDPVHSSEDQAA